MWYLLLLLLIPVFLVLWLIGGYNGLVRLRALVDEAWSGVDVQLKRRYDLIPNLVSVVKQYGVHEQTVLENVTKYRSVAMGAPSLDERGRAEGELTGALKTLFAVAEQYPDLKANSQFMALQESLGSLEQDIQFSRRYYNGAVRDYMTRFRSFPTNLIASWFGFGDAQYFEVQKAEERDVPQVKF